MKPLIKERASVRMRDPQFDGPKAKLLPGSNRQFRRQYNQQFRNFTARDQIAAEMAKWLDDIIAADTAGVYVPIVLTFSTPLSLVEVRRRFFHAAVDTSRTVFPELSRSNSDRHPVEKSVGVILLPAMSADGLMHYHGFVRLPVLALPPDAPPVPITIHESSALKIIEGPRALLVFVKRLRHYFHPHRGRSTSIWLGNHAPRDGARAEAADHRRYPQIATGQLSYLQNAPDGEVRQWTDADCTPKAVFKGLASVAATAAIADPGTASRNRPVRRRPTTPIDDSGRLAAHRVRAAHSVGRKVTRIARE